MHSFRVPAHCPVERYRPGRKFLTHFIPKKSFLKGVLIEIQLSDKHLDTILIKPIWQSLFNNDMPHRATLKGADVGRDYNGGRDTQEEQHIN